MQSVESGTNVLNGMRKRPRNHPRSLSLMPPALQREKRQMKKNLHSVMVLGLTRRQQRSLLRQAQRQHRRL
jgi:hypothetical protein